MHHGARIRPRICRSALHKTQYVLRCSQAPQGFLALTASRTWAVRGHADRLSVGDRQPASALMMVLRACSEVPAATPNEGLPQSQRSSRSLSRCRLIHRRVERSSGCRIRINNSRRCLGGSRPLQGVSDAPDAAAWPRDSQHYVTVAPNHFIGGDRMAYRKKRHSWVNGTERSPLRPRPTGFPGGEVAEAEPCPKRCHPENIGF